MGKILSFFLISELLLITFAGTSVYAQTPYPVKDSATTIVGEGTSIGGSVPMPDPPTMEEFMSYVNVYSCAGQANVSNPTNCRLQGQNSELAKFAYRVFSKPMRSSEYVKLLNVKNKKINLQFGEVRMDRCHYSGGGEWNEDDIRLDGYLDYANDCGINNAQWSMIHESAHIIKGRNPSFFSTFPVEKLADKDGDSRENTDCYDPGSDGPYIETYAYRAPKPASGCTDTACGGGAKSESFGEAVGMNVACGPGETCTKSGSITNYPRTCKATYDWIKKNVYGGVDFFGLGGASDVTGFVFYCQMDPRWDYNEPQSDCELAKGGCVPTSTAMVVSSLGTKMTPPQVISSWINFGVPKSETGCRDGGMDLYNIISVYKRNGQNWFESQGFRSLGYSLARGDNFELRQAKEYLDNGWLILAGVADFPCTPDIRCGEGHRTISHEFVITAVDPEQRTITIRDPIGCYYSGRESSYDRTKNVNFGGNWWHAYPIKKR